MSCFEVTRGSVQFRIYTWSRGLGTAFCFSTNPAADSPEETATGAWAGGVPGGWGEELSPPETGKSLERPVEKRRGGENSGSLGLLCHVIVLRGTPVSAMPASALNAHCCPGDTQDRTLPWGELQSPGCPQCRGWGLPCHHEVSSCHSPPGAAARMSLGELAGGQDSPGGKGLSESHSTFWAWPTF